MKKPDAIQAAFVNECIWLWRNRKAGVLRQPTHESAWFSPGEPTTAVKHNIWQSVLPQPCVALGQQHHPGLEAILLAWRRPTEENDRPPLPSGPAANPYMHMPASHILKSISISFGCLLYCFHSLISHLFTFYAYLKFLINRGWKSSGQVLWQSVRRIVLVFFVFFFNYLTSYCIWQRVSDSFMHRNVPWFKPCDITEI